jgi:seryl-tRNA synthetase
MLDIKLIRQHPQAIQEKLRTKVPEVDLTKILEYDTQIREKKTHSEQLKAKRNEYSDKIGMMKKKGEPTDALMKEVQAFGDEIQKLDHELVELEAAFTDSLARLPNIPMDDVKISQDPKENVVVNEYGKRSEFSFTFKNHLELNEDLDLFDFVRGAKLTGSGWPLYKGMGARLEWALINYMVDFQVKNGYTQWMPPIVVKGEILYGSGQLPKFENQQYALAHEETPMYMIPTAEIPLNGLHADEIFDEEELPLKYAAYTPCFRREAGGAGAQERGLIRMHQFNKVEMFIFCKPEDSPAMFDEMVSRGRKILEGLELHHRSCLLVTGDMSFAAAKTIDLEVWLPGQNRYYEVSSISNCTDYQSRRSNIRYRKKGEKPLLVHTLNGSGLATSRLMVAILENNQQADGSVIIPKVLRSYLDGQERLVPKKRNV